MITRTQVKLPGLNHRLVLELDRGRVREMLLVVALSGLMILPLLAYVWQNIEWVRAGYRLERLKTQRDRLVEMNHQLRLEKASLESLARVEKVAAEQLGLAQPPPGTVVLVDTKSLKPARRQAPASVASAAAAPGSSGSLQEDAAARHAN